MKKHIFLLVTVITTLVSCAKYDYDAILEQLRDHEERLTQKVSFCFLGGEKFRRITTEN